MSIRPTVVSCPANSLRRGLGAGPVVEQPELGGPATELLAVVEGDAEQLADDQHRQGEGEQLVQVAAGPGGLDDVEPAVHQLGDVVGQPAHPPRRERGREQLAHGGVVAPLGLR
ncbi:hypothetical protein [Pseudonocardia sp. HH130629-09]|uniref:hypothetical protein n=1 Tax=Pseudonocardia sp. HH130629-09 TaxID=1641402 RepID=UPI0032E48179